MEKAAALRLYSAVCTLKSVDISVLSHNKCPICLQFLLWQSICPKVWICWYVCQQVCSFLTNVPPAFCQMIWTDGMGWLLQIVLMKFEFCKIFIVVYMFVPFGFSISGQCWKHITCYPKCSATSLDVAYSTTKELENVCQKIQLLHLNCFDSENRHLLCYQVVQLNIFLLPFSFVC